MTNTQCRSLVMNLYECILASPHMSLLQPSSAVIAASTLGGDAAVATFRQETVSLLQLDSIAEVIALTAEANRKAIGRAKPFACIDSNVLGGLFCLESELHSLRTFLKSPIEEAIRIAESLKQNFGSITVASMNAFTKCSMDYESGELLASFIYYETCDPSRFIPKQIFISYCRACL
jgi:hypothetical protein